MKAHSYFFCILTIFLSCASYNSIGEEKVPDVQQALDANVTRAVILLKKCKSTEYPVESIKRGEEGKVQVKILIDTSGIVKESLVIKSSGFKRLDDETIKYFSACKYFPATENSIPINAWQTFDYAWRIEQGRKSTWKP